MTIMTQIIVVISCLKTLEKYMYAEMESLAEHGICLPPNMQGLTDEQLDELHLVDEWKSRCIPSGGPVEKKDPMQRRNGYGIIR